MADLLIRDVPKRVHDALKRRARKNGRSVNAEVLEILAEAAKYEADAVEITARMRELAREINLPPDAPKAEDIIKEGRAERSRKQNELLGL